MARLTNVKRTTWWGVLLLITLTGCSVTDFELRARKVELTTNVVVIPTLP